MARRRWPKGTWMKIRPEAPQFIKDAMKMRGLSYRQIGEDLGVSHTMLHQLVTGRRRACTPALAERYERYLGFLPGFLFVPQGSSAAVENVSQRRGRAA